jgi:hypothetical protein
MKFECGDLERAFANADLMAEAREHLRDCAACRNEYRIWNEISAEAKQLHCEWESPDLWPTIRQSIEAARPAKRRRMEWKHWTFAAAALMIVLFAVLRWPQITTFDEQENHRPGRAGSEQDFLTEQALKNVENNETAYRRSIEELSRLAQAKLANRTSSPILASYREQLLMVDSAIVETRSNVAQNRFNVRLQTELADLYRDKQQILREVLTGGQRK